MKHEQVLYENVQLVSNFLKYKDGILNGFNTDHQPMIHTFNKNETAMYYEMAQHRKHIILMGLVRLSTTHTLYLLRFSNEILIKKTNFANYFSSDSLGDADMADEKNNSSVLKIGFLFDHVSKNSFVLCAIFHLPSIDCIIGDIQSKSN